MRIILLTLLLTGCPHGGCPTATTTAHPPPTPCRNPPNETACITIPPPIKPDIVTVCETLSEIDCRHITNARLADYSYELDQWSKYAWSLCREIK